jgi:hypothetical protein
MASKVQKARLALAEAILREMQVKKMTPLANKLPKNKGGRGYAQLDTIERMKVRHDKAMEKLRRGKRTLSDEDDERGRHSPQTPGYRTDQFATGTGNYMNRGKTKPRR